MGILKDSSGFVIQNYGVGGLGCWAPWAYSLRVPQEILTNTDSWDPLEKF